MATEQPTEKQIDFATTISEMLGIDLPNERTKETYRDFIADNKDEFEDVQREIRYKDGNVFSMNHSYVIGKGFCGESELNINPYT